MFCFGFFCVGTAAQRDNREQKQTKEGSIMAETAALFFHLVFNSVSVSSAGNAKGAVTLTFILKN
jgi:hypothetical protein